MEKADIMPRPTTMPEGLSTGDPPPDAVSASLDEALWPITVMREWKSAKAWLYRELAGPTANGQ